AAYGTLRGTAPHLLASGRVPNLHLRRPCGHALAVRAKGQAAQWPGVSGQGPPFLAGRGLPQPRVAVAVACEEQPPVRAEGHATQRLASTDQAEDLAACGQLPDADRLARRRQVPPVRAEGDSGVGDTLVGGQRQQILVA